MLKEHPLTPFLAALQLLMEAMGDNFVGVHRPAWKPVQQQWLKLMAIRAVWSPPFAAHFIVTLFFPVLGRPLAAWSTRRTRVACPRGGRKKYVDYFPRVKRTSGYFSSCWVAFLLGLSLFSPGALPDFDMPQEDDIAIADKNAHLAELLEPWKDLRAGGHDMVDQDHVFSDGNQAGDADSNGVDGSDASGSGDDGSAHSDVAGAGPARRGRRGNADRSPPSLGFPARADLYDDPHPDRDGDRDRYYDRYYDRYDDRDDDFDRDYGRDIEREREREGTYC